MWLPVALCLWKLLVTREECFQDPCSGNPQKDSAVPSGWGFSVAKDSGERKRPRAWGARDTFRATLLQLCRHLLQCSLDPGRGPGPLGQGRLSEVLPPAPGCCGQAAGRPTRELATPELATPAPKQRSSGPEPPSTRHGSGTGRVFLGPARRTLVDSTCPHCGALSGCCSRAASSR